MNRKSFIKKGGVFSLGIGLMSVTSYGKALNNSKIYNDTLIKEFVIAGHFNLDKVKNMLNDYPNLIHSCYDWGNGDFEEAIEGAAHKGNREIAEYLISKGSRVNLFALTMLGQISLVKPILDAYPNLINSSGPHGLTLLHHAKVGGKKAQEMYNYLIGKGLTKTKFNLNTP